MSVKRVLADNDEPVDFVFSVDGQPVDADGVVTATVTRHSDGAEIVAAAALDHVGDAGSGTYRHSLAAQSLDWLDYLVEGEFSGATRRRTQRVEVVGGFYCTLSELRAMPDLSSFTDDQLAAALLWFETTFERHTRRAFVPRYFKQRAWWDGRFYNLKFDGVRSVRSVTVDGTALSEEALALVKPSGAQLFGLLAQPYAYPAWHGAAEVVVAYEHGWDSPPEDIVRAAKVAVRQELLDAKSASREYSTMTDFGLVRHSTPSKDRPFGIPFVDEVANSDEYRRRTGVSSVRVG